MGENDENYDRQYAQRVMVARFTSTLYDLIKANNSLCLANHILPVQDDAVTSSQLKNVSLTRGVGVRNGKKDERCMMAVFANLSD